MGQTDWLLGTNGTSFPMWTRCLSGLQARQSDIWAISPMFKSIRLQMSHTLFYKEVTEPATRRHFCFLCGRRGKVEGVKGNVASTRSWTELPNDPTQVTNGATVKKDRREMRTYLNRLRRSFPLLDLEAGVGPLKRSSGVTRELTWVLAVTPTGPGFTGTTIGTSWSSFGYDRLRSWRGQSDRSLI
ncbi:hypothetical protein H4582DRAFT_2058228 [Lactarius indigo]|nr:hypothetical protein H4582DRAFT_2058228 [Lactarius indigo]